MAYNHINFDSVTSTYTQALTAIPLNTGENFSLQYAITVNTPSAATFTAAVTDICTAVAHGMSTGLKVQVSSDTTLPSGLSAVTDYFVIYLTANTFKLATSLVNAQAGTAVDITDTGTGVHTVTPTALAGCSISMEESVDGSNFYAISGVTANITTSTTALLQSTSKCGQIRPKISMTAGQISVVIQVNTK